MPISTPYFGVFVGFQTKFCLQIQYVHPIPSCVDLHANVPFRAGEMNSSVLTEYFEFKTIYSKTFNN